MTTTAITDDDDPRVAAFSSLPTRGDVRGDTIIVESELANLGAMARNCRGLGAAGMLVDPRGGDIYARKAIRTSMGNVFAQTIVVHDIAAALPPLRAAIPDLCVAAATLSTKAISLREFTCPSHTLLILGNEGDGVPHDILTLVDRELTIPMHDGTDSLNVGAASAVFLYGLSPQRRVQ